MKYLILISLYLFSYTEFMVSASSSSSEPYLWKNRLLVTCDKTKKSIHFKKISKLFSKNKKMNDERKLKLLKNCLYKNYKIESDHTILVGLDGGIKEKFKKSDLSSMKQVYDLVDKMPMRARSLQMQNKRD